MQPLVPVSGRFAAHGRGGSQLFGDKRYNLELQSRMPRLTRLALLPSLALLCLGCRADRASPRQDTPDANAATQEGTLVTRCAPGTGVRIIEGEVIQTETKQVAMCQGDSCANRTVEMMSRHSSLGKTCVDVRKSIQREPIVDAWGARAHVVCNAYRAQAISAGRDGRL